MTPSTAELLRKYGYKTMREFMKKNRIFDTREAQIALISMYEHDSETERKENHNE